MCVHLSGDALCPPKTDLITQQGGTLLFEGDNVIFQHRDSGILVTPDVDELMRAASQASSSVVP